MLKTALSINGIFSGFSGLLLVLLPDWFAIQLGLAESGLITEMGFVLLVFSLYLGFLVVKQAFGYWFVVPVIVADLLWVVASVILGLQFHNQFSGLGLGLVVLVAVIVMTFADLQAFGLYRHKRRFASG